MSPARARSHRSGRGGSGWKQLAVAVCAVVLGAAAYVGLYLPSARERAPLPERRAPMEIHRPTRTVKIFLPREVGNTTYLAPVEARVPASAYPPAAAMAELIRSSRDPGPAHNLIPPETRVLGIRIRNGSAEVDLSSEFVSNFAGGSHQEALTLNAIAHTMAQFPGARKTHILIEGKPTDTLGGHLEITQPFAPDPAWLQRGGSN